MGIRRGEILTPIVADGLVFNMDAANRASYPVQRTLTIAESGSCYNTLDLTQSGSFISDPQFLTQPVSASCWSFDGVDDYIDCGDISTLNAATNLTFNFWGKKATGDILGIEAFNTATNKIILYWWSTDTMYWGVRNTGTPTAASSALADFGNWHHFVGTYEGSSGTIKLYIDGSLVNTQTGAPSVTTDLSGYFKISKANGAEFGIGQIANLKIYNRALTTSEVLHNYNALKGRFS